MRKQLTTKDEIKEQILKTFQEKKEHIKRKIRLKLKDIPKKFLQPSYMKNVRDYGTGGWKKERVENERWTKARTKLSNAKRPTKNKNRWGHPLPTAQPAKVAPTPHRVEAPPTNSITITIPSSMAYGKVMDLIAIIRKSGVKCNL